MLKIAKSAALLAAGLFLATSALAQDKAAATVNGVSIPQARLDMQVQQITSQSQGQVPDSPELRENVLKRMIDLELVSQAATKKGLDKQPEYREQLELLRQQFLAKAYVTEYKKNHPVSEDKLRQEYDKLKAQNALDVYKVSLIVVKSEKEAKALVAKLKKGANFAALAKKSSIHPSKANGGALGVMMANSLPPPLAGALVGLGKGQVSNPVQTEQGWNIIRADDSRIVSFEEAKPNLIEMVQGQGVQAEIEAMSKDAKIEKFQ